MKLILSDVIIEAVDGRHPDERSDLRVQVLDDGEVRIHSWSHDGLPEDELRLDHKAAELLLAALQEGLNASDA